MISRRTGLAATALLTGASGTAATATAPRHAPGLRSHLQSDVDAILATGATGVLAEVRSAHGRTTARAGSADLTDPPRRVLKILAGLPTPCTHICGVAKTA
ncbi:hypothetical protein [Streptomyces sp. NPDC051286]|uniref:hypothetical protein n=1 Tax=Streptomyces sp. NPDC051286 TaxID=3365647 RepID=UPI0037AF3C31